MATTHSQIKYSIDQYDLAYYLQKTGGQVFGTKLVLK